MKSVICEEVARLCQQVYHDRLRAVILTGSLARDEATFVKDDEGALLLGDAEFLLVFGDGEPLPTDADVELIRHKLEERIAHRGLRADVTLTAVRHDYLRRLPPSIFAYELRVCGEVVTGDASALSLIPDFPPADIPLEDAWRLLANRLVEQLESMDELLEMRSTLSPRAHYRTVKLHLDLATSLLVSVGRYAPTYAERARNLRAGAGPEAPMALWPLRLDQFVADVTSCTEWKLSATGRALGGERALWERGVTYAQAVWRWELSRLLGSDPGSPASALMTEWMRSQPFIGRLRGWAHVVRKRGWHSSWREWPRWLTQASYASPRHIVYSAATALLFEVSDAVNGAGFPPQLAQLRRRLPVTSTNGHAEDSLRTFAATVVRNYKDFVTETRA